MLTKIWMENFKGIGKRQTIDLAPVTFLFGINSAGKSTVLHALHYLRKIFVDHDLNPRGTVAGDGTVDLGGFDSLLHQRNDSRVDSDSDEKQPDTITIGLQRILTPEESAELRGLATTNPPQSADPPEDCQNAPRTIAVEIQIHKCVPAVNYTGSLQDLIAIRHVRIDIDEEPFAEYSFDDSSDEDAPPTYNLLLRQSATHSIWKHAAATHSLSEIGPQDTGFAEDREDVRQWLRDIDSGEALDSSHLHAKDAAEQQPGFIITDLFGIPEIRQVPDIAALLLPENWEQENIHVPTIEEKAAAALAQIEDVNIDDVRKLYGVALYRRHFALTPEESCTEILQAVIVPRDSKKPDLELLRPKQHISALRPQLKDRFPQSLAFPDAIPDEKVNDRPASTHLLMLLRDLPHYRFSHIKSPPLRIASQAIEFLRKDLEEYKYIGPKRATVPRDLTDKADDELSTWGNGLGAWRYLLHCDKNQIKRINDWLGKPWMETGYEISRQRVVELVLSDLSDAVVDDIIMEYTEAAKHADSILSAASLCQDADDANRQRRV